MTDAQLRKHLTTIRKQLRQPMDDAKRDKLNLRLDALYQEFAWRQLQKSGQLS